MSKILVTGACGFIGSHLVEELLSRGHEVVGIDNFSGGSSENAHASALTLKGDILDTKFIDTLFAEHNFDYIYHLAAYAAEGLSPFIRRYNYQNNLLGSMNLINASIKHEVKHFTFLSSIAVYGDAMVMEEDWGFEHPVDPYGVSKLAVELDLESASSQFGLDYTVFRPHNVYGERQNLNDPFRNVIGIFMRRKIQDVPVVIFGDGNQTRSFTYVKDIIPAIADAPENKRMKNQTFNIGTDQSNTINDLVRILRLTKVQYEPARHEVKHTTPDHKKINDIVQIKATPLDKGIKTMWQWAQAQELKSYNTDITLDITEGLPPSWKSILRV